jgi:hypothetical protein
MKLLLPLVHDRSHFRKFLGWLLACAIVCAAAAAAAKESGREIMIELDSARVVKIPDGAHTLVIGNPLIADVTMLKNNQLMVITGKSFGTTNLIVLDNTGMQVGESLISVVPALSDKLVVMRGPHRESYSCKPECVPTVDLADDHTFLSETIEAIRKHQDTLTIGKH